MSIFPLPVFEADADPVVVNDHKDNREAVATGGLDLHAREAKGRAAAQIPAKLEMALAVPARLIPQACTCIRAMQSLIVLASHGHLVMISSVSHVLCDGQISYG